MHLIFTLYSAPSTPCHVLEVITWDSLESKHLILQTYTNNIFTCDCSLNAQLQLIAKAA